MELREVQNSESLQPNLFKRFYHGQEHRPETLKWYFLGDQVQLTLIICIWDRSCSHCLVLADWLKTPPFVSVRHFVNSI